MKSRWPLFVPIPNYIISNNRSNSYFVVVFFDTPKKLFHASPLLEGKLDCHGTIVQQLIRLLKNGSQGIGMILVLSWFIWAWFIFVFGSLIHDWKKKLKIPLAVLLWAVHVHTFELVCWKGWQHEGSILAKSNWSYNQHKVQRALEKKQKQTSS